MITFHWMQKKFDEFLSENPTIVNSVCADVVSAYRKNDTYKKSVRYIRDNASPFHTDHHVQNYLSNYIVKLDSPKKVIDVGCASGITGLNFLEFGHHVTFHDYDGIGLEFLRWLRFSEKRQNMLISSYECSLSHTPYDIVVAFDVLEHTGNHLGFLKWMESLGKSIVLCFPYSQGFTPPYEPQLDEWVDVDAICNIINLKYKNVDLIRLNNRLFAKYDIE